MSKELVAKDVIKRLSKLNRSLSVAESITAGGLAHHLTKVPGSSKVFLGGIIAYSDEAKMLDVSLNLIMRSQLLELQDLVQLMAKRRARSGWAYQAKKRVLPLRYLYREIEKLSATPQLLAL
jgi:nicotinamide mononucleotide (NMN) deamidase PncC